MAPASPPPAAVADKLWKRLGGEDNVNRIVDDFLKRALNDEKVNFTRGKKYPLDAQKESELKQKFVAYISDISDGTVVRTAPRSMAEVHKGMNITDAQFNALVEDLKKSLDKFKVPDKEQGELLSALGSLKPQIVGQ